MRTCAHVCAPVRTCAHYLEDVPTVLAVVVLPLQRIRRPVDVNGKRINRTSHSVGEHVRQAVAIKARVPRLLHLVDAPSQVLSPARHPPQEVTSVRPASQEDRLSTSDSVHLVMAEKLPEISGPAQRAHMCEF